VQAASSEAPEQGLARRFAKAAGADEMLNVHDLKADYEKAIGHATQRSTVYNLLHRHGMAQGDAGPIISQARPRAQNAFKKGRSGHFVQHPQ
jgi:hypothetical protein